MKRKYTPRASSFQCRRTLRLSATEDARLAEEAAFAGLTVSEYMRRRFFGGRPILAQTDASVLRELRRMGGLLKHNFETLRQAKMGPEFIQRHEDVLRVLMETFVAIRRSSDDRKEDQDRAYVEDQGAANR